MWLTSFVVKSFATAKKYFKGSERKDFKKRMIQSINWMQSNRELPNALCFKNVGQAIHSSIKGPSLTASASNAILSNRDIMRGDVSFGGMVEGLKCAKNRTEDEDIYSK